MNIVQTVKSKPVLIGGGLVLFLLILFLLNRGGGISGGGTEYVSTGPSPAQLQAQTALALAQIDAGKAAGQTNAQVAVAREQVAADLNKAVIEADLSRYLADKQAGLEALSLNVNAEISRQNTAAQVATTKYLADLSASTTKYQLDQAAAIQANNNEFQLSFAEQANQTQTNMAIITSNLTMAQLEANRDVTLGVLTSQQNLELARITASRDVQLGRIDAQLQAYQIAGETQAARDAAVISSLPLLKTKNRDDVLKSYYTGEYGYSGPPVSGTAQTIGAIGGAAASIGKLVESIF
jgi:hypothetical protein